MLFQMCYGPEIQLIYEYIRTHPNCTVQEIRGRFQYQPDGDITSLIDAVVTFLSSARLLQEEGGRVRTDEGEWNALMLFQRLHDIAQDPEANALDHVFTNLYEQLFVVTDRMFIKNLHYHTNQHFSNTMVGQEKINAWKRMMECFGLGYRAYSGFYALPHQRLLTQLISRIGAWRGPIQQYCEEQIHPIIPCIHNGRVFRGMIFGLAELNKRGQVGLMRKQDLPNNTYGEHNQWNWIEIKEEQVNASMSVQSSTQMARRHG